jgi:phenylalanyl-tRNA synthetase beta chain
VRLFESGHVYLRDGERGPGALGGEYLGNVPAPAYEPHRLGALLSGPAPPSWREADPEPDYFVAKAVVEAVGAALGVPLDFEAPSMPEPFLHPGRSALVSVDGAPIGWLGELHPLVARDWDLALTSAFELDAAPLIAASPVGVETYEDVTTYPAVLQDIAAVVPADLSAADLRASVLDAGGELLRDATVFDRYEGEQVGEGKVSLALRLEFRSGDRTLTDDEVAEQRKAIAAALEKIGGGLRE